MATQGETDFIDQYTRKLMVELCHVQTSGGTLAGPWLDCQKVYLDHAVEKGWLSKDRTKVLAAGWQTAARFLKR